MTIARLATLALLAQAPTAEPAAVVRAFVDAYNERDFRSLEQLLDPDASWYAIDGERLSRMVSGRANLVAWNRDYLGRACPTCRSELASVQAEGAYVSSVERASWRRADGSPARQSGLAVYEVRDGRIRAVWYFSR